MKTKMRKGFTLVEILIVVIILGILAAIVIPQFTEASEQANESKLKTDLQTLRSQISLYLAQNNGADPIAAADAGGANLIAALGLNSMPANPLLSDGTEDNIAYGAAAPAAGQGAGWYYSTDDQTIYAASGVALADGSNDYDL